MINYFKSDSNMEYLMDDGSDSYSPTQEQMVSHISYMTLLEATEVVNQLQESFDFNLQQMVSSAPGPAAAPAEADTGAKEQTAFDVMVQDVASDKRVAVLKVIRKLTSLGLADAKGFTTSLPKALKEGVSKEEAEEAKTALEEAGATVTIV